MHDSLASCIAGVYLGYIASFQAGLWPAFLLWQFGQRTSPWCTNLVFSEAIGLMLFKETKAYIITLQVE